MKKLSAVSKKILDTRLRFKHFVLTGSVIFIIMISIALFLIVQNTRIMREQISSDFNQQQLVLAHQVSSQIRSELSVIEGEIASLANFIDKGANKKVIDDAMEAMAERTHPIGVTVVALVDIEKRIVNYCAPGSQFKVDFDLIIECSSEADLEHSVLGPLYVEPGDTESVIIAGLLCKKVRLKNSFNGVFVVKIDISQLIKNVTSEIRSGRTGYAWVINKDGMFLYHPESEFVGRNAFTARQERQSYISFAQINHIMKDQMLKGEEGTGKYESGWHRGMMGRMEKLIAYTPVKSAVLSGERVWSVAVAAPITEVAEAVDRVYIRNTMAEGAIIIGMFVFVVLMIIYQRRMSRALKLQVSEKEQYISAILRNSIDAIIFIDNFNRVKVWNKGAELIFGYSEEEMLGRGFHKLIPPDIGAEDELQRIQREVINKGHIRHYRAKRITKNGRRITIDLSRTLIHSDDGEILGSTAIIRDVTDAVELERRIYNTEKLASIGTLAAGVAHEINNPLAIILGFVDLLLERFEEDSQEYEDLKLIEENANNAKKIVENMLGFARVTEGSEDVVDVPTCIETVVTIIRNTLMTKKVTLTVDAPGNLSRVRGDAREFQQVIFNLVNNAIAAMEKGGGKLTISARTKGNWVHIDVSDTGIGIPEKNKRRIFDPFFTTQKVGKGTGLGLSLCYGIVEKYGGKMTFTSVSAEDHPDKPSGSTFTVSMPIDSADATTKGG